MDIKLIWIRTNKDEKCLNKNNRVKYPTHIHTKTFYKSISKGNSVGTSLGKLINRKEYCGQ